MPLKGKSPSPEGEYFTRVESEKLKKLAQKKQELLSEEEKKKLKELHWMPSPIGESPWTNAIPVMACFLIMGKSKKSLAKNRDFYRPWGACLRIKDQCHEIVA